MALFHSQTWRHMIHGTKKWLILEIKKTLPLHTICTAIVCENIEKLWFVSQIKYGKPLVLTWWSDQQNAYFRHFEGHLICNYKTTVKIENRNYLSSCFWGKNLIIWRCANIPHHDNCNHIDVEERAVCFSLTKQLFLPHQLRMVVFVYFEILYWKIYFLSHRNLLKNF